MLSLMAGPLLEFRERSLAASLKLVDILMVREQVVKFRERSLAASLKLEGAVRLRRVLPSSASVRSRPH